MGEAQKQQSAGATPEAVKEGEEGSRLTEDGALEEEQLVSEEEQRRLAQNRYLMDRLASRNERARLFLRSHGFVVSPTIRLHTQVNEPKQTGRILKGFTFPLHAAAEANDAEAASLLLTLGADMNRKDSKKRTPLRLAKSREKNGSHAAVIAVLEARAVLPQPQLPNKGDTEMKGEEQDWESEDFIYWEKLREEGTSITPLGVMAKGEEAAVKENSAAGGVQQPVVRSSGPVLLKAIPESLLEDQESPAAPRKKFSDGNEEDKGDGVFLKHSDRSLLAADEESCPEEARP